VADKSQQTEKPTSRRIQKAREEGQFPQAKQLLSAVQFAVFAGLLSGCTSDWFRDFANMAKNVLRRAVEAPMSTEELISVSRDLLWHTAVPLLVGGVLVMVAGVGLQLAVTQFGFSLKKLAPDLGRLNPATRLQSLFSENLRTAVEALVLLPILFYAVYSITSDNLPVIVSLPRMALPAAVGQLLGSMMSVIWRAVLIFGVVGGVLFLRDFRRHAEGLKMSKQEIRDEVKQTEGNPENRGRVRRMMRDLLRRQMMKQVKTATAVVVNPTHYAVALRYDMGSSAAPVVVAKGKNRVALRIRQIAEHNSVPIVENPPLARGLYASVKVGQAIPAEFFKAVAEVLAYIYRIMNAPSRRP
jgi:flagellar biosynthetic protein FlhB